MASLLAVYVCVADWEAKKLAYLHVAYLYLLFAGLGIECTYFRFTSGAFAVYPTSVHKTVHQNDDSFNISSVGALASQRRGHRVASITLAWVKVVRRACPPTVSLIYAQVNPRRPSPFSLPRYLDQPQALYSVSKNPPANCTTILLSGKLPATPYSAAASPPAPPFLPFPSATRTRSLSFSSSTTATRSAISFSTAATIGSVTATWIAGGFCSALRCHPFADMASAMSYTWSVVDVKATTLTRGLPMTDRSALREG